MNAEAKTETRVQTRQGPALSVDSATSSEATLAVLHAELEDARAMLAYSEREHKRSSTQQAKLEAKLEASQAAQREVEAKLEASEALHHELEAKLEASEAVHHELEAKLEVVLTKLAKYELEVLQLRKKVFGRTSEKNKTNGARRKRKPRDKNDTGAQRKRRKARDKRNELPFENVDHKIDDETRSSCPHCDATGEWEQPMPADVSTEWEYVPGQLVRRRHRRETVMCRSCKGFVRADGPDRVYDRAKYGPGFIAYTIVTKCADCVPLYRQAKAHNRCGVPVDRSTLVNLFHRGAEQLAPLYARLVVLVATANVVFADETTLKMQRVKKLAYIWTFASERFVTYVFSPSRSGETPLRVLADTEGNLVVDAYSGYNNVCIPERRLRAGCNSHARRKFTDADDEGAEHIIALYRKIWDVEEEAKRREIVGTAEHLELRRKRAGPAMNEIKAWCEANQGQHTPKSPMGKAIGYLINQWEFLTRFLTAAHLPVDNNFSERLLRVIALGRKNYLFVGHVEAGENLAGLCSLIASCELHGVNPQHYLTDVLIRVQNHPAARIDELLPDVWGQNFGHLYE